MGIPVPDQKNIGSWMVYIMALALMAMFGFWRAEIDNVKKATEQVAEVQKRCDDEKIQAAKEQIERLNALYNEMKSNHEKSIDELRRLRKR
jgi:predicted negative regulator of RcsB-dependent stress response